MTSSCSASKKTPVMAEFTVSGTTLVSRSERSCLHCQSSSNSIQVSCDSCGSFICNDCHWCHEYQAHHEIRVCDRCDSFLCRECDEMDQCGDCGEVVCGGCDSLQSCKFCGSGLCEECKVNCGKCGIVLCQRDQKFAVECGGCGLGYCLVCLASGNKDPCIRCHQRPSKKMEQLVHLRLKSIYKAFQQSHTKRKTNTVESDLEVDESKPSAKPTCEGAAVRPTPPPPPPPTLMSKPRAGTPPRPNFQDRQAQADAAAAALLAELDQEAQAEERKKKCKKKRKKKKIVKEGKTDDDDDYEVTDNQEDMPDLIETNISPSLQHEESEDSKEPTAQETSIPVDSFEAQLCDLVGSRDQEGIEQLVLELKGVPGRAALRKNAKKALKRLREEHVERATTPSETSSGCKLSDPLIKLVSQSNTSANHRGIKTRSQPQQRHESTMHMAPSAVGWVIGKGGQRIRDLMESTGANVWIDQDSMGPQEPRVVYVSGQKDAVDEAIRKLTRLIANMPPGGVPNHAVSSPPVRPHPTPVLPEEKAVKTISLGNPNHNITKPSVVQTQQCPPGWGASSGNPAQPPVVTPQQSRGPPPGYLQQASTEDWVVHEMSCEPRFVPLLIGRRGWTIKNIQDTSGARVDIDQSVTPRKISISGSGECVRCAIRMVSDVLSYPHAQLHHGEEGGSPDMPQEEVNYAFANAIIPPQDTPTMDDEEMFKKAFEAYRTESDRAHSPPPSSLIVTGDIQSTVSASSSLSSTPEPFGASSAMLGDEHRTATMQTGFGIEHYVRSSTDNLILSTQHMGFVSMDDELGKGMDIHAGHLYSRGLTGMSHDFEKGMDRSNSHTVPSHEFPYGQGPQQRETSYGHAQQASGQSLLQEALGASMGGHSMAQTAAPLGAGVDNSHLLHGGVLNGILQQQNYPQQQNHIAPLPPNLFNAPTHLLFQQSVPAPNPIQHHGIPGHTDGRGCGPLIYGQQMDPNAWGLHPPCPPEENLGRVSDVYLQEARIDSTFLQVDDELRQRNRMPTRHGYNDLPLFGARVSNPGLTSNMDKTHLDVGRGGEPCDLPVGLHNLPRDDSHMVDSLFAPVGSGTNDANVLSGFQALSMNDSVPMASGSAWACSIPGWGTHDVKRETFHTIPERPNFLSEDHVRQNEQLPQQQPSHSRFDWG